MKSNFFANIFFVQKVDKARLLKIYQNKYEASFEIIEVNNFPAQLFPLIELFMASGGGEW